MVGNASPPVDRRDIPWFWLIEIAMLILGVVLYYFELIDWYGVPLLLLLPPVLFVVVVIVAVLHASANGRNPFN